MEISMEKICRCCMVESNALIPIFSKKRNAVSEVQQMLNRCTKFELTQHDKLPQKICLVCLGDLNKAFSFIQKIERTANTLRTYLEQFEESSAEDEDREDFNLERTQEHDSVSKEDYVMLEKVLNESSILNTNNHEETFEISVPEESQPNVNNFNTILNKISPPKTRKRKNQNLSDEIFIIIPNDKGGTTTISENSGINVSSTGQVIAGTSEQQNTSQLAPARPTYKCEFCFIDFFRQKNLANHLLKCTVKNRSFEEEESVPAKRLKIIPDPLPQLVEEEINESLKINPNAKQCRYCQSVFANEKSLKFHENSKKCLEAPIKCKLCEKNFGSQENLAEHLLKEHSSSPKTDHKCSKCSEVFESLELLQNHSSSVHSDAKKHLCVYCGRSFGMLSTLKDHIRTHTREKPFICKVCNKGFSQNTNLKQHLARHSQIKPFKCEECNADFVSKGELSSHMRKHTKDHPYQCEQCESKFTTSSSLVKHRRIHSGEKSYACSYCPLRFTASGTLKNHILTHTGERPHKCSFCDRTFTQKSDCISHERIHKNERPYQCKICSSSFHQAGTLRTHMKTHNKDKKE